MTNEETRREKAIFAYWLLRGYAMQEPGIERFTTAFDYLSKSIAELYGVPEKLLSDIHNKGLVGIVGVEGRIKGPMRHYGGEEV